MTNRDRLRRVQARATQRYLAATIRALSDEDLLELASAPTEAEAEALARRLGLPVFGPEPAPRRREKP